MPLDQSESELRAEVRAIAQDLSTLEGPLLPILHAVQERFGHVPEAAVREIADVLNQTAAEVHGVASFYHDFRTTEAGQTVVKICKSEACKSMGADALVKSLETSLGVDCGQTSKDGRVTLEPVYCLGLCACAPAAQVDGRLVGRATTERITSEVSS